MNYIEYQINELIKKREQYLKSGLDALKAYGNLAPSTLVKLIIQRDLGRVKKINSSIDKLKQQNAEFKSLINMDSTDKSLK